MIPASRNSTPRIVPSEIGPPPPANVSTSSSTPMTTMMADKVRVAARWTSRGSGTTGERTTEAVAVGGTGLDDDARGPFRQDGLDGLAERRGARAGRQWQHDRPRTDLLGLLDDDAARLPGAHLRPAAAHAPPEVHPGLLDDSLGRHLLVGQLGVDGRRVRDRDGHEDVDPAPAPR